MGQLSELHDNQLLVNKSKRVWQSWSLSLLAHGLMLAFLIVLLWSVQTGQVIQNRPAGIVLAIVDQVDQKTEYLTEAQDLERTLEPSEDQSDPIPLKSLSPETFAPPGELSSEAMPSAGSTVIPDSPGSAPLSDVSEMLNSESNQGLTGNSQMSEEDLKRLAEEQARIRALQPVGEPITLSVFGSGPMTGRKFVFLLDQSESMGSGGLGVLDACKSELKREIDKLHDYHQFQIVAYNERTSMIGRRRLLAGTDENKSGVESFIDNLVAAGGTNHEGGLIIALGFEPDVIVMISDGGDPAPDENSLGMLRRISQGKTQIHCLQFGIGTGSTETKNFMRQLAAENGGSFRYIDVGQWTTNKN